MNEMNNLSHSEMLHLMLDGELDSSYESTLFNELSQNEELRQEMRDMLAIRESVKRDFEAFTPPASVTKSLFNNLGYNAPAVVNTAAKTGFWTTLTNKVWHPVTTAVLASIVTSLLFLNFYSNNSDNRNQDVAINQNNSTPVVINFESKVVPEKSNTVKAKINKSGNFSNVLTTDVIEQPAPIATNIGDEQTTEQFNVSSDDLDFIDLVSMSNPISMNFNNFYKPNNQKVFVMNKNQIRKYGNEHSLLLQLKSMTGSSYPNISLNNQENQFLSNFTISAFTPLTENWQLGLEAGQEAFPMSFWDIDDTDNYLYRVEQNPSLIWAGLGLKYKWNEHIEFLANSQPFAHLTIASTAVGPLFKSSIGIQFVSDNGFGIIFGIDGSSLVYQNESKLYTSNKLGISYGMFMQF